MAGLAKWDDQSALNYWGAQANNFMNTMFGMGERVPVPGPAMPQGLQPATVTPPAPAPQTGRANPDLLAENAPSTSIAPSRLPDMLDMPQSRGLTQAGPAQAPVPNITDPVMADRVQRLGLTKALQSPAPNVAYSMMRNDDGKGYTVRETINGGLQPTLREPEVDVTKFQTRTGWDKKGNPVYSTGAAEMAAVNAGIADYNRGTLAVTAGRDKLWQEQQGGLPLQQAQAAKAAAEAANAPAESQSMIKYREAMAEQAKANAGGNDWKPYTYQELAGDPKLPETVNRQGFFNVRTGETRNPMQAAQQVGSALSTVTPEEKSAVLKYFGDRKDVSEKDIASYLEQLRTARGL